jgi:hypothetical protein
MAYLMERVKFTFQTALFFKVGSKKDKLKEKIIFLFILMDHFIEVALEILLKTALVYYFFILVFNIKEHGKMVFLMVKNVDRNILIKVYILEISIMVLNKVEVFIYGQIKKDILDNLEMDIWKVMAYYKKANNHIFRANLFKI